MAQPRDNYLRNKQQRGDHIRESRERNETSGHDTSLSKSLSYLLRHGAPKEKKVTVHPGGYLEVDEILRLPKFSRWSVENIKKVVEDNDKQRFTLRTDAESGKLFICANQGHSFEVGDLELLPITNAENYPVVIHGTYLKSWNSIQQSGLRKMNRIHIHFAPGVPGEKEVISGMRKSAEIYIYVDIAKALNDGLKFYQSKNNVILCPGNEEGILETKYFLKVVNVKTNEVLLS
ncbi:tRNA 2'-phosphotransferase 1 [Orchesella cincta]|uniref:2'-phosphotransferase n=1 Tax=Orchesella cincta TaxID=48709 RepID=A0A1D2MFI3_ORCCI|nr:tRNA 2'-phosphotransferase 1 [Orchesella cincta]